MPLLHLPSVSEGTRRGSHGLGGASGGQPVGRAAGGRGRGPAGSGEGRDAPAGVRRHLGRVGPSPALRPKRRRAELGSRLHAGKPEGGGVGGGKITAFVPPALPPPQPHFLSPRPAGRQTPSGARVALQLAPGELGNSPPPFFFFF